MIKKKHVRQRDIRKKYEHLEKLCLSNAEKGGDGHVIQIQRYILLER